MVDLSERPEALNVATECELDRGKWTKEGQGFKLGGMQEAQNQICVSGRTYNFEELLHHECEFLSLGVLTADISQVPVT